MRLESVSIETDQPWSDFTPEQKQRTVLRIEGLAKARGLVLRTAFPIVVWSGFPDNVYRLSWRATDAD